MTESKDKRKIVCKSGKLGKLDISIGDIKLPYVTGIKTHELRNSDLLKVDITFLVNSVELEGLKMVGADE